MLSLIGTVPAFSEIEIHEDCSVYILAIQLLMELWQDKAQLVTAYHSIFQPLSFFAVSNTALCDVFYYCEKPSVWIDSPVQTLAWEFTRLEGNKHMSNLSSS